MTGRTLPEKLKVKLWGGPFDGELGDLNSLDPESRGLARTVWRCTDGELGRGITRTSPLASRQAIQGDLVAVGHAHDYCLVLVESDGETTVLHMKHVDGAKAR